MGHPVCTSSKHKLYIRMSKLQKNLCMSVHCNQFGHIYVKQGFHICMSNLELGFGHTFVQSVIIAWTISNNVHKLTHECPGCTHECPGWTHKCPCWTHKCPGWTNICPGWTYVYLFNNASTNSYIWMEKIPHSMIGLLDLSQ